MRSIIIKSAIVLGLGIAPGVTFAQSETELLKKKPPAGATTQQQTEGQAGATTTQPPEGQAGATTEQPTDGQAATTVKPPEGQAGATTEGQAGATTEQPAEGQAGTTTTRPPTEGQADATTDQPAEGQGGTAQTEQPPAEGQTETEGTAQTEPQPDDATTQDQTSTGAIPNVNVTVEQKTEIKQVIQEADVEPVAVDRIDFDINVGVAVPRTIEVYTLPPRIVKIVPAYEGYRYFLLADGRIVIVEPDTLKIVVIIV